MASEMAEFSQLAEDLPRCNCCQLHRDMIGSSYPQVRLIPSPIAVSNREIIPDILTNLNSIFHLHLQDMGDEWGMGVKGDKLLPIHPRGDEWKINGG